MQGWITTTRHGTTRKRRKRRKIEEKDIGKLIREKVCINRRLKAI